jgi:hypothetical protein
MTGRIVTFYERALTTSVNDIEHIESTGLFEAENAGGTPPWGVPDGVFPLPP